jgi:hypothetical protein
LQAQFLETKVPHCTAVRQLIQKFKQTGSVCDATRSGTQFNTDREESVGYFRLHATKPEEVHQEFIPGGWCIIWHGPTPTPLQNYSSA